MENNMEVLQKTKYSATIWPCNPTLGHISRENYGLKDICTPTFTEALFTTAKPWRQPKYPLTDEQIKKIWYTYTTEYCCCCLVAKSCLTLSQPHGLPLASFSPWISPGKNTGVGCHVLLQRIFRTQGWTHNSCIGRWVLYHWASRETHNEILSAIKTTK